MSEPENQKNERLSSSDPWIKNEWRANLEIKSECPGLIVVQDSNPGPSDHEEKSLILANSVWVKSSMATKIALCDKETVV